MCGLFCNVFDISHQVWVTFGDSHHVVHCMQNIFIECARIDLTRLYTSSSKSVHVLCLWAVAGSNNLGFLSNYFSIISHSKCTQFDEDLAAHFPKGVSSEYPELMLLDETDRKNGVSQK